MQTMDRVSQEIGRLPEAIVLGVRIHQLTIAEAVARVRYLLASDGAHQVVTVNGAMLVYATRDPHLRELLNRAALATPDGVGVLLAGRILGCRFPERVAGIDLVERLCALSAHEGFRLYLFGAQPGVAESAAAGLRARYPGLEIVGVQHGYLSSTHDAKVIEHIQATRPHLLFVGLGAPRQEDWIATHLEALGSIVCIGVGGTFDVLAGRRRRAPQWMQRAGLEWVYRGIREPKRWKVIVTLPLVIWLAFRARTANWWGVAVGRKP